MVASYARRRNKRGNGKNGFKDSYDSSIMKELSIISINNKAPLQVTSTRNGAFEFYAENSRYIVGFVEDYTIMESGVYQFFIENANDTKNTLNDKVFLTIVSIIEEFFACNNSAILYICDIMDGKQSARDRLFAMWFNLYEGNFNYTLSRISLKFEETDYYASLLISNTNPYYTEVLTAFNDFAKELTNKLE